MWIEPTTSRVYSHNLYPCTTTGLNISLAFDILIKRKKWGNLFLLYFTGVPLGKMPIDWMPMEPDNKNNDEDCVLYVANGTIADINCNDVHPYICYKKRTKFTSITGCGTIDKGWLVFCNFRVYDL